MCDNILSGYLCAVATVFSQQDGIYGFKFLKRFLEISPEISLFSLFDKSKDLITNPAFGIDALSLCICMAQCLARSQPFSHFIRPSSSLSYTSKTYGVLNIY
jgi:hypothetical protein